MNVHMFLPLEASPVARSPRAASPAARSAGRREEEEDFCCLSCRFAAVFPWLQRRSPELLSW